MRKQIPRWIAIRLDPIELLLRVILGGVFVFAAWGKLADPGVFSLAVRNYQILGDPWVAWVAMGLPVLELILGVSLIARVLYPGCIVAALLLLIGFVGALLSLMLRGIDVECGCLGAGLVPEMQIFLDLIMIVMAAVLLRCWRGNGVDAR
jgi:putative oxidoreductase